jgi:hypothetical protein
MLTLKKSAKSHHEVFNLIQKSVSQIKSIPNFMGLKCNQELTKSVCVLVEDFSCLLSNTSKSKVDKSALVVEILTKAFGLTEEEVTTVKSQLQFLVENKMISPTSLLTRFSNFFLTKPLLEPSTSS